MADANLMPVASCDAEWSRYIRHIKQKAEMKGKCKYLQFSINGNKFYCIFVASNSLKRQNEEVKREFTVGKLNRI